MKKAAFAGLGFAALLAAGYAGYRAGQGGFVPPMPSVAVPVAKTEGRVLYYRDPDGPFYATEGKTNSQGRAYLPVREGEDISFEPPARAASGERKIRFYRNPMGLPDTSPKPKKDSMGMDYIPVYEGEEDEAGGITLSPGKVQRTGIRTEAVVRRDLGQVIRAPGLVALDERLISVVSTRVDAFVEHVAPVTTGESVVKGQPLVSLFSAEIAAAAALFITELNSDEKLAASGGARKRLENLGVPREAIAGIEQSRKVPLNMVWRAPRDGIVLERAVTEGMKMASGVTLFRIADITRLWVLADIPERERGLIRPGAKAVLRLRHAPERVFTGAVTLLSPQVSLETRTTKARIEVENADFALVPNMFGEVEIQSGDASMPLAVPENAVIDDGRRRFVFLSRGEGHFEPREVKTGARGNGYLAVVAGLAEGDEVVTAANFLIDAESNLKSALQSLAGANVNKETSPEKGP